MTTADMFLKVTSGHHHRTGEPCIEIRNRDGKLIYGAKADTHLKAIRLLKNLVKAQEEEHDRIKAEAKEHRKAVAETIAANKEALCPIPLP